MVCLLTGVAGAGTQSDYKVGFIRINGHVLGPTAPMENETLTLKATDREWVASTRTDGHGAFSFVVQPNQRYVVHIAITGFDPWDFGIDAGEKDLDVGDLCVRLPAPVRVLGKLMDYTGDLLPNQTITLESNSQDGPQIMQSGPDGAFSFDTVPPNRHYTLHVDTEGLMPTAIDLDVRETNVTMGALILQPMTEARQDRRPAHVPSQRNARVSGRIVDERGTPQYQVLTFQNESTDPAASASTVSTLKLNAAGTFIFPAEAGATYHVYPANQSAAAEAWTEIGKLVIADTRDVDLGAIVVSVVCSKKMLIDNLIGPVGVTVFPRPIHSASMSQAGGEMPSVAAIFLPSRGPVIVILSNGADVRQPAPKEQVGASLPLISPDKQAAGWLIDSDFCCTSYPIDLTLALYRLGKPIQYFTSDGRAIFRWHFVGGGRDVAFYQDFLHGTPAQHYELRDVDDGRLIDKWDGELTSKAPHWARGFH